MARSHDLNLRWCVYPSFIFDVAASVILLVPRLQHHEPEEYLSLIGNR